MQNLSAQLPPLEPLVAFEAAARLQSFTLAAEELNLSQAAISQRIRNLESFLGTGLFVRSHRAVQLSPSGIEFQHAVSATLRHLACATADLKAPVTPTRLTVATDQSVASLWLMPRLPDFKRRHSEFAIRLIASDEEQDCLGDDVQVAIIHGNGNWPGFNSELLFKEEVFAVCSPSYLRDHSAHRSVDPTGFAELVLLELEDKRWDWMNWRAFLSAIGSDHSTGHAAFRINSYPLVIDAARNGQGIALGWRYLVDDDLASGALVKPFDCSVSTQFGYYLVWPHNKAQSSAVIDFREWSLRELTQQTDSP
ncbi:hypothetical protein AB833_12765 [Chromatiales bacterium (ex Bugula neritina AB1)]|nr:hypothetical protein AB833_12765 [Chromatiales bacterium (ex Bugula neritina AB1)]